MTRPRLETVVERDVFAEDGTRWRVREARAFEVPGAQADSCLIGDTGKVCRRFWKYPPRWNDLTSKEIMKILDQPRR